MNFIVTWICTRVWMTEDLRYVILIWMNDSWDMITECAYYLFMETLSIIIYWFNEKYFSDYELQDLDRLLHVVEWTYKMFVMNRYDQIIF